MEVAGRQTANRNPKIENPFERGTLLDCWRLGLMLWRQAGQRGQPGASQLRWWRLVVAIIGTLLSYVTLMRVNGGIWYRQYA
jgi:hypothetical protein